jgi:uncharacterized protein (TIGR01777 family)
LRVAVTGSTGFIGPAVVAGLRVAGHDVVRVVRGRAPLGEPAIVWDPEAGTIDAAGLEGVGGVVHLAGRSIGAKRWTAAEKRRILESRDKGTRLLAETLARLPDRPSVLVSASASHYYGNGGERVLTEDASPGRGFLADVTARWEAATEPAAQAGIRVVTPRSAMVLGLDGGALPRLARLTRLGLGGRLGRGRQWWSWITLDDQVSALRFLLEDDALAGPVNVATPNPVTNAEFAATMGRVLHRPTFVPTPAFGPRLWLGEMAGELLFYSQRLRPDVLLGAGFTFAHPELEPALRDLLDRPA